MEIIINKDYNNRIAEDYSDYEQDDLISILSIVCRIIDESKIASFSILFSIWDERFNNVDFRYDFTSIAPELEDLLEFLQHKEGLFVLHFYELDRRVHFKCVNEAVEFSITTSVNDDVLFEGIIAGNFLEKKVKGVLENFRLVLNRFFPKAFKEFIKSGYILNDNS